MNCPHCNVDLTGPSIYEHFLSTGVSEQEALRTAKMYGATKTEGTFDRQIGIYDTGCDRTVSWRCPDCGGEWPR